MRAAAALLGLAIPIAAAQETPTTQLYLAVTGSDRAVRTGSWERLRSHFSVQLAEAASGGERVTLLQGSARPPAGATGMLVNVHVMWYFYVSDWVRNVPLAGGRRATLNATARIIDLRTGAIVADRSYDKASHSIDGSLQEATEAQVRAIADDIVQESRRVSASATAFTTPTALRDASPAQAASPAAALPSAPSTPDRNEIVFWESVRDSKKPEELQAYLKQYPQGVFAPLARARLAAMDSPATPPAPTR